MRKTFALLALVALTNAGSVAAQLYDFNSLVGGGAFLNGQDGWTTQSYVTPGQIHVQSAYGFDGTNAIRFNFVGAGYGADASRLNDANFSLPSYQGFETGAFFDIDERMLYWGTTFGLGYDADGSGTIRRNDGAASRPPGLREHGPLVEAVCNPNIERISIADAAGNRTSVSLLGLGAVCGDWLRLRLVMDFTANGGQGAGSLFYQNMTAGDPALQPVPGLQNINLALDPAATDAFNPTTWDGLWLHFEGSEAGLDNIFIPTPDTDGDGVPDDEDLDPLDPDVTGNCADIAALAAEIRAADPLEFLAGSYRVILGYMADAAQRNCALDDYRDVVTLLDRIHQRVDSAPLPSDWMPEPPSATKTRLESLGRRLRDAYATLLP